MKLKIRGEAVRFMKLIAIALLLSGCANAQQKSKPSDPYAFDAGKHGCKPGESGGSSSPGSYNYMFDILVCAADGKHWTVDKKSTDEAMKRELDAEKHKEELLWALRSRVLTDAEMSEVQQQGTNLFTRPLQPFFQKDVDEQLNQALAQQFRLRVIAKQKMYCAAQQEKP